MISGCIILYVLKIKSWKSNSQLVAFGLLLYKDRGSYSMLAFVFGILGLPTLLYT